jgi:nicotinate-nucleotide adenylyltransferase
MPEGRAAAAGVCGLLGGTFDPVHCAHLALARAALESGIVDRLRIVPAGHPPHRAAPAASAADRLAMVRLAVGSLPRDLAVRCEVDSSEVARAAPSYTIDTLERLRTTLGPRQPLALILGADAFLGLPTWHRWNELLANAHLLITERPGHRLDPVRLPEALRQVVDERFRADARELASVPAGLVASFDMPAIDLSATRVRALLACGEGGVEAASKLLPADVVRYIHEHHLYSGTDGYTRTAADRH